jgi:3-oxo-5alpha-steroid 4-dehydrogenase
MFDSGARRVTNARDLTWDDEADVVVVGFGGAGAVTALQARQGGASVIAIDRFGGGGATHYSGGVMYAGGTRYQRESGFNDTPEEMYKYLDAEGSAVKPETLKRFCEGSNADVEWLEGFGIPHGGNAFLEKTSFPPDGYWLYYSGNEKVPAFVARAKPAPRGHRVVTPGAGGHVRYDKLQQAALRAGVKLLLHAPAKRLVVDAEGRVLGVEVNSLPEELWQKHQALYRAINPWQPFNSARSERAVVRARALEQSVNRPKLIRGNGGVVLSTGGFVQNRAMLGKYRPVLNTHFAQLLRLGSLGDDGSGIALGESVGGVPSLMDNVCVARTVAPPNKFVYGILVNQAGKRFINEAAYSVLVGGAILEQPGGGKAWLILKAADFWTGLRKSFFPGKGNFWVWGAPALLNISLGGTRRASTLAMLARKIGVDPNGLIDSVEKYNATASGGVPDALGKAPELMSPLSGRSYFAVNTSVDNKFAPMPAFTMGGLAVDEGTGAVTRKDGSPIKGLYAAGRAAVGLCSNGYVSGLSIADVVFSGRRAGREIARLVKSEAKV